jgi:hypothetical protein
MGIELRLRKWFAPQRPKPKSRTLVIAEIFGQNNQASKKNLSPEAVS